MAMKDKPEENVAKSKGAQPLEFKVGFEGKPDKAINSVAYAFDRQGTLLASAPVKKGSVQLTLKPDQARTARIFFAPEHPRVKGEKPVTLDTMERLHAYEATWTYDAQKRVYELLPIPEFLWRWWFLCMCRVRGQVVKPVNIAGVTTNMPVCNARVHICEVDPIWWIIVRLPDPIIVRLRDELLQEIEHPRPIPIPDPPPFKFDPGVIDPSPENIAKMNRTVQSQPLPLKENVIGSAPLALETRVALASQSIPVIRQALQNNIALIRSYLCWWPWIWPWLCRCDEITTITTNAQGGFDTTIWYLCFGDHPDLYFWVEYSIGGAWTTVYHPNPICCHTYWNYVCGSEMTLHVTDPRVVPCGDPPPDLAGLQVAVLSIGNNASMHEIPVDSTPALPLSGSDSEGLANGTHPFGGRLEPHVNFSRSALINLGITHYRWSYRQLTEIDGVTPLSPPDTWHAMDRRVIRHYQVYDPVTSTLTYPAYLLGPDPAYPGEALYKIQPIDAPTGRPEDWAPNVDAREDSASAFFLSHLTRGGDATLGAGKYELKFELFNTSGGAPAVVDFTHTGIPGGPSIALKVPDVDAPFGAGTVTFVDADDHHRFKNGAGDTVAFRVVLRVDNNPCEAEIYQVYVDDPANAAGPCGFIGYANKNNSKAHISFKAHHPNKFAMFDFVVAKGSTGEVFPASDDGQVNQGGVDVRGFKNTPASGLYWKDVPVIDLLNANGVDCDKAAFSETLEVDAMATDGWNRLRYLDKDGTPMAFALEPAA